MAWFGKLIGGSLGFSLGGPLGAVLGAAMGHAFDAAAGVNTPQITDVPNETERQQAAFFVSTFALLGKMAKADGVVTSEEISVVERYMARLGLDEKRRRLARQIFTEAKDNPLTHLDYARGFVDVFAGVHEMKLELLQILADVARADGRLDPAEARVLAEVAECLGVRRQGGPSSASGGVSSPSTADPLTEHYATLGVSAQDDWPTIKRSYRELAQKFHPDRLVSKGLPEEFSEFAKGKLQEINAAYEALRKVRESV